MKATPLLALLLLFHTSALQAEEPLIKARDAILNVFEKAEEEIAAPLTRSFLPSKPTERKGILLNPSALQDTKGIKVNHLSDGTAEISVPVVESSAQRFNNILFQLNSTQFADEVALQQVQEIAAAMKAKPNLQFLVEGHTCDLGTEAHNHQLSEDRANAVRAYLIREGVSAQQILTLGFGETDPSVANLDESSRRLNRRVVVYVRQ